VGGTPAPVGGERLKSSKRAFGLGRFDADGGPFLGAVVDDVALPVSAVLANINDDDGLNTLFPEWDKNVAALGKAAAALRAGDDGTLARPLTELKALLPVEPPQIFLAGMNYRTHVIDLMVDSKVGSRPDMDPEEIRAEATKMMDERAANGMPFVFTGLASTLCGPEDDIQLRRDSEMNDWELELAAVIGRPARNVSRDDALSYVGGWTVANDVTSRDLIQRTDSGPVGVDWLRSKLAPTYLPVGPYVVPSTFVEDPQDLTITLKLNGEVMQNESTSDMVFDVAALIEYISSESQLLPGDILLTGSPAGNGTHYGRFLQDGDLLEGTITGLGTQRNRCVGSP
jgi:2-keto-4-pentenoate hydratase/2-oxohepta-3-ene-1,7-dioic acid hydratase in catechol pathway